MADIEIHNKRQILRAIPQEDRTPILADILLRWGIKIGKVKQVNQVTQIIIEGMIELINLRYIDYEVVQINEALLLAQADELGLDEKAASQFTTVVLGKILAAYRAKSAKVMQNIEVLDVPEVIDYAVQYQFFKEKFNKVGDRFSEIEIAQMADIFNNLSFEIEEEDILAMEQLACEKEYRLFQASALYTQKEKTEVREFFVQNGTHHNTIKKAAAFFRLPAYKLIHSFTK